MDNLKHFIMAAMATFMVLSAPLLVHASDNSIKILPAEGNVQCSDYAANKVIESMGGNVPGVGATDTYTGPENTNDPDNPGGEEVDVTLDNLTTLSFANSTTPIDFALLKSGRHVTVLMYNGAFEDGNMTNDGEEISAFALCYGLVPTVTNSKPTLSGDNVFVTVGDPLDLTITASDDGNGLPDPHDLVIEITAHDLPHFDPLTDFTITGDNFNKSLAVAWTPNAADEGMTYTIEFTAYDGEFYSGPLTVSITVNALVVTPSCEAITKLDQTGVSCPAPVYNNEGDVINGSIMCNMELDKEFYGTADKSDICCACNTDGPLVRCDPELAAGEINAVTGLKSCNLTEPEKAELNLPPAEMPTHFEFNNDPWFCYTQGAGRVCFEY